MVDAWNRQVAGRLREAAALLEQQQANPFRVRAYRRGADTVERLDRDIRELFEEEGQEGLTRLPHVGRGLAAAIREILTRGRWSLLERLRGDLDAERLFQTIPGIGPTLARRIHDELGVDTLEALEVAAHDGRLGKVAGIGEERASMVRSALDRMLRRGRGRPFSRDEPGVDLLLDVDRVYRDRAESGELPTIAPRRFNPDGESWLPILHGTRDSWHFTALYSNTARAHELGRTRDWVVIYFYDEDDHHEGQSTVVTETQGPMRGKRVVRGREPECEGHYEGREQ